MSLLKDFEALCKYVRECTGDDIVCGLCEYDAGTVGEEPMECPGFESNECFVLKESLRKQYEMYDQVIRCKDCKHWRSNGDFPRGEYCTRFQGLDFIWHSRPEDFCSLAEPTLSRQETGQSEENQRGTIK